jgi:hypothetical protein
MNQSYDQAYNNMTACDGLPRSNQPAFSSLAENFKALWIGTSEHQALAPDRDRIQQEKHRRQELANAFADVLSPYRIDLFKRSPLDFTWRFSFLSTNRWLVHDLFGANGFFVSRWYPPLDRFFPNHERSRSLKNSNRLGREIFNIALPPEVTVERIQSAALTYRSRPWRQQLLSVAKPILGPVKDRLRKRFVRQKSVSNRNPLV